MNVLCFGPFFRLIISEGHRLFVTLLFLVTFLFQASAQKQLVFFNHGKVAYRFMEGSDFKCVLKNHQRKEGFIVELREFSMITSNDTIPFQSIAKLYGYGSQRISVTSGVGGLFFIGGLGFIAIDQLNGALGYGPPGFDQSDRTALIFAGIGAVILFARPRSQRVDRGMMIRTIDYTSPYYLNIKQ